MQFFRKNASQIHSSWRARAVNNPCMSWCSTTASAVVLHSNFPLAAAGWKLPHFLGKKGKSTGKSYYHLRGISLCNCIHGQWFHSSFLMAERDHSMTLWVVAMPSLWWCSQNRFRRRWYYSAWPCSAAVIERPSEPFAHKKAIVKAIGADQPVSIARFTAPFSTFLISPRWMGDFHSSARVADEWGKHSPRSPSRSPCLQDSFSINCHADWGITTILL